MPRVMRNYKHTDFTELLNELNGAEWAMEPAKAESAAPNTPTVVISPERRRRDSLMGSRKMRYAYSAADGVLHDRDCPQVKRIRDEDFRMLADIEPSMELCSECRRKALLRAAIPIGDAKRITAYLNVFNAIGATNEDIRSLAVVYNAVISDVTLDSVRIKVRDDSWIIRKNQYTLELYHNNYEFLEYYDRIIKQQYHLQQTRKGDSAYWHLSHIIFHYSWPDHVERMIAEERSRRREELRIRLAGTRNAVRRRRFSLLYKYYTVVDCDEKAEEYCESCGARLDVVLRETNDSAYATLLCRVRRWEDGLFRAGLEKLKEYCVERDRFDYADRCEKRLSVY